MGLKDLNFYLKLATIQEYTISKLEYKNFETISKSFEPIIFKIPQKTNKDKTSQESVDDEEIYINKTNQDASEHFVI
jgi:hypothetical protein